MSTTMLYLVGRHEAENAPEISYFSSRKEAVDRYYTLYAACKNEEKNVRVFFAEVTAVKDFNPPQL